MTTLTAPSAASAPGTRRVSRQDIVAVGRASRPWDFLPLAVQALRQVPADVELRFLTAANFAQLGLVTPARDHLALLPAAVRADPPVLQLQAAIDQLPTDIIDPSEVLARVDRALHALAPMLDLTNCRDRWRESRDGWLWLRARDGNVIRWRRQPDGQFEWMHLGDHRAAARRQVAATLGSSPGELSCIYIDGVSPPWTLIECDAALPRRADGFAPRLVIVEREELALLDAAASADCAALLASERVELHVGPQSLDRLTTHLRDHADHRLAGPVVPSTACASITELASTVSSAERAQQAEHHRLAAEVNAIYAPRDRAWWAQRFADAQDKPLRVLIPTTRYSTFIQHSAEDLAAALRAAGCDARVLIERDRSSKLSSLAYLRTLASWTPDLVILINYFRPQLDSGAGWLPRNMPFVTWIQDEMPHQRNGSAGTLSPLDFLIGHVDDNLRASLRIPERNVHRTSVVASSSKFHAAPVDPALAARLSCDVAFVSHHSETPRAMHARLCREATQGHSSSGALLAALDAAFPRVQEHAADPMRPGVMESLRAVMLDVAAAIMPASAGDAARVAIAEQLWRQYAIPVAERTLRHQTLEWARAICARRGWTFRVHGRGWEQHPTLATHAAPPLEHGDELRASYHLARVHLHASLSTLMHQRVLECAMSGGLPACRFTFEALDRIRMAARRDAWMDLLERSPSYPTGPTLTHAIDTPSWAQLIALEQRLGIEPTSVTREMYWPPEQGRRARRVELRHRPGFLLGDPSEICFRTPEELERIIERAIDQPRWRSGYSTLIAERARQELTSEGLAPSIVAMVRSSLTANEPTP